MPRPEILHPWSSLTRRDKRGLQFRPGYAASHGLQERVISLGAHTHVKEYKGPNPNIPPVIVGLAYKDGGFAVKYLNSIDSELARVDRMEEQSRKGGGFKVEYRAHPSLPRDYLTRKYGPLSLDDLARLSNQLSRKDLRDIFEFWLSLGLKSSFNQKDRSKASALYGLVGNFVTGTDNGSRPNFRIQRIRASLLAPLRFYREHLLNFSSDEDIDLLVKSFPDHIDTLALIYSFETSGLSLSSIQKLLVQRRQQLAKTGKVPLYKKLLNRTFGSITSQAIADIKNQKRLNTPWDYLFYEPELDKSVEDTLEHNYDLASSNKDGLGEGLEKSQQLIEEWSRYHSRLANQIITKPVDIAIDEHPYISNIKLMARTKESTHFVLFFKTSDLYLTLDIDSKGRLFGLPPNLAVRFPHADLAIFGDVLSTLIPKLEKMFPETTQAIRRKKERKAEKAMPKLREPQIIFSEIQPRSQVTKIKPEAQTAPSKPPKRKALPRESYIRESQLSPELEIEISQTHPTRMVEYSENLVRQLAGKRMQQRHITQLMNAIRRFEFGFGNIKYLNKEQGDFGAGALGLKSKSWRIIFKHQGGRVYRIVRIARRDHHVYD